MHDHTSACAPIVIGMHAHLRTGEESKRRWLAYDERGGINSRVDEGFNAVEVVMHDTALARRRPPILNDFYGFSLAALGDKVGFPHSPAFPFMPL